MQIKHSAWCGLCVGVLGCGAGLPIFPGLVRYEEIVLRQELRHAVRFTVSRSQRAIVAPARSLDKGRVRSGSDTFRA